MRTVYEVPRKARMSGRSSLIKRYEVSGPE
jgi:hypothetical protein